MSWFKETKLSFLERFCMNVLRCGPIPRHVAFIMDGNRRYAKKFNLQTIDGHRQGFDRMTLMLEWCLQLGVEEVTVYAFSIENFKRPQEEVDKLMTFAKEMFEKLIQEKDKLNETGKSVRVFGDLSLLPEDIQRLVADIVLSTKHNTPKVLNICFAYTSRHEISTALNELRICVQNGLILESDITETLISKFLYTNHSSEPDLLVRTSGEVRLSDFLLWQTSYSVIAFANVLWPEFTIWDLFSLILYYQRNCSSAKSAKQLHEIRRKAIEDQTLNQEMQSNTELESEAFLSAKTERINKCLSHLEDKRLNQLKEIFGRRVAVKS